MPQLGDLCDRMDAIIDSNALKLYLAPEYRGRDDLYDAAAHAFGVLFEKARELEDAEPDDPALERFDEICRFWKGHLEKRLRIIDLERAELGWEPPSS